MSLAQRGTELVDGEPKVVVGDADPVQLGALALARSAGMVHTDPVARL